MSLQQPTYGLGVFDLISDQQLTAGIFLDSIPIGLVIGLCWHSIILIIQKLQHSKKKSRSYFIPALMIFNNVFNSMYTFLSFYVIYVEENCQFLSYLANVSNHAALTSFTVFILYFAYIVSNKDIWVKRICNILVVHRVGWAIYDLCVTKFVWDPDTGICNYMQDPHSVFFNFVDLTNDCFTTLVNLRVAITRLSLESNITQTLMERNLVRSIVVVTVSAFALWVGNVSQSQYWLSVVPLWKAYVLARCINFDLLFEEDLEKRLQKKSFMKMVRESLPGQTGVKTMEKRHIMHSSTSKD
ncbi:hypothetical protein BC830DRAFT_1171616 [Chytriomyces sp. MP71]|nr:hypothetical protein BC830DRAFT_1171616 [Chytriomyces sp. MP71]